MDEIDAQGYWWRPEHASEQLPGRLTWSNEDGVILHLLGTWEPRSSAMQLAFSDAEPLVYPVLHGRLQIDPGSGRDVTLLEALVRGYAGDWPSGSGGDVLHASRGALFGHHISPDDVSNLDRVRFELERLWDWTGHSGFANRNVMRVGESAVDWRAPEPLVADTAEGARVELRMDLRETGGRSPVAHLEEIPYVHVEVAEPADIDSLARAYVKTIRNLVTLATDEPVEIIAEYYSAPSVAERMLDGRGAGRKYLPLERRRIAVTAQRRERERLLYVDMLFRLADAPGGWAELIPRWLSLERELARVLDVYFAYRTAPARFVEGRFLSLVQVLEGYHSRRFRDEVLPEQEHRARVKDVTGAAPETHREWARDALWWANRPTLDDRLRETLESTGALLSELIPDTDAFVKAVKRSRNSYTHVSQESDDRYVLRGGQLFWLAAQVDWMIKLRLLIDLGFEEQQIGELLKRNERFQWAVKLARRELADVAKGA